MVSPVRNIISHWGQISKTHKNIMKQKSRFVSRDFLLLGKVNDNLHAEVQSSLPVEIINTPSIYFFQ